MSLKVIKNKIRSVKKTRQLTKAMESVSAVKMRKSQQRALDARPYALHALSILKRVSGSNLEIDLKDSILSERPVKKTCIIVITSDRGLAGSLNGAVLKSVTKEMEEKNLNLENTGFVCVGRKGYEFFSKRGFKIEKYIDKLGDDVSLESLKELSDLSVDFYNSEKYDSFIIAYTNFLTTTEQKPIARTMLPVSFKEIEKVVEGIVPEKGKFSDSEDNTGGAKKDLVREYIFEPSVEQILKELLPFLLNIQVYHSLLEAKASEHSARMVAMKNASDKAGDVVKSLTRDFNKVRQAAITREISEITGGIEAMDS